ncbi:cation:proton antiporter regulatory subunit [Paenibacillus cisolokensis]|jgi:TrkA domain protein|uniref:Potassium transporter n=1 Tax=Paenibacillus cisolokensis TaxID=1658519 RepID=A0ABQ4N5V4_9BACL|nr:MULTISPECIES: cation:proton antiporter regulatory subunit [Paenibacillus]ALS28240.1 potassium transporter [Paenibacillus sp. 32O-W]GIQ63316.1 potassium transporter [Paenibacillus cisolokensis]
MNLRESDLPGIGRKYELHTRSGERLVIIIHNDERREIYHMDPDDPDDILSTVTFDDDEARMISAILAGITYKPKALEQLEMVLDDLVIEWIRLDASCGCVGRPIGELDIRRKTGAIIIAIVEKNKAAIINPGPHHILTGGTTAIVAGERMNLHKLKMLLQNGSE